MRSTIGPDQASGPGPGELSIVEAQRLVTGIPGLSNLQRWCRLTPGLARMENWPRPPGETGRRSRWILNRAELEALIRKRTIPAAALAAGEVRDETP